MDPKKSLTAAEVNQFFSATHEFQVIEEGNSLKISYTDDGKTTSSLMWNNPQALTVQQLIRKVQQLVWNHCNNILD